MSEKHLVSALGKLAEALQSLAAHADVEVVELKSGLPYAGKRRGRPPKNLTVEAVVPKPAESAKPKRKFVKRTAVKAASAEPKAPKAKAAKVKVSKAKKVAKPQPAKAGPAAPGVGTILAYLDKNGSASKDKLISLFPSAPSGAAAINHGKRQGKIVVDGDQVTLPS